MDSTYKRRLGFTLIELLIVIAVIGLLSSIAIVSISVVRAKTRDVKRIADLKQLVTSITLYANQNPDLAFAGCAFAGLSVTSCQKPVNPAPELPFSFATFVDPSPALQSNVFCDNNSQSSCQYSIDKANPKTDNFQFCFYLETNNNPIGNRGPYKLLTDGSMIPGCDH